MLIDKNNSEVHIEALHRPFYPQEVENIEYDDDVPKKLLSSPGHFAVDNNEDLQGRFLYEFIGKLVKCNKQGGLSFANNYKCMICPTHHSLIHCFAPKKLSDQSVNWQNQKACSALVVIE